MITVAYLQTVFEYHQKADQRIFAAAEGLTDAELDQRPIPAHGSLRETFVHAISAMWMWRNRLTGVSPTAMLDPGEFPSFAAIRARAEAESAALQQFIDGLSVADIEKPVTYVRRGTTYTTLLWQILVHVDHHGAQHRSELAAMLTVLGRSPGELDIISHFRGEWEQ